MRTWGDRFTCRKRRLFGQCWISSYGQWFQIRTKITCLANQKTCFDEGLTSSALDDGLSLASAETVIDFALAGAPL